MAIPLGSIVEHVLYYETCVGLTFETIRVSCEIGLKFPFFVHKSIVTSIDGENCKFIVNRMSIEFNTFVVLFLIHL